MTSWLPVIKFFSRVSTMTLRRSVITKMEKFSYNDIIVGCIVLYSNIFFINQH